MKQPQSICKDCKYFAFVHDHDLEGYSRYECCCTNENYQPQPYISQVTGKTVTPRSIYVWCDQANKDGDCAYWEQRFEEPVVVNEGHPDINPCISSGCLIYVVAFLLMFAAIDGNKTFGYYGLAGFALAFTLIVIGIFYGRK